MHHSYDYVRVLRTDREQDAAGRRLYAEVALAEIAARDLRAHKRERAIRRAVTVAAVITIVAGLFVAGLPEWVRSVV